MDDATLLNKVKGSLMGHTIGDRLGWPYEIKTPEQIVLSMDDNGLMQFINAPAHDFNSMRQFVPGQATDDTQHAFALCRSLIRRKKFDPFDFAGELMEEYGKCQAGWGKGSKASVREMALFYATHGRDGRSPAVPAPFVVEQGAGNGVSMKAHVLGLWQGVQRQGYYPDPDLCRNIRKMGEMTHGDPRAADAAYVLASLTYQIMWEPITKPLSVNAFRDMVWSLKDRAEHSESKDFSYWSDEQKSVYADSVRSRLAGYSRLSSLFLTDPILLRETVGTKCFAPESTLFAMLTFLRHPLDFAAGMHEVIAAGGDTDSNAAMYGALAGANGGMEIIPKEWREYNQEIRDTEKLAIELFDAARLSRCK